MRDESQIKMNGTKQFSWKHNLGNFDIYMYIYKLKNHKNVDWLYIPGSLLLFQPEEQAGPHAQRPPNGPLIQPNSGRIN